MIFTSHHIKGHGRGKTLGFPTINMEIPEDLVMEDGVYSAWVTIGQNVYKGALHYGPTPTFSEREKTLEVFLVDTSDKLIPEKIDIPIGIDIVSYIRRIEMFTDIDILIEQITKDVEKVRRTLG